jgi:hypothetical protein
MVIRLSTTPPPQRGLSNKSRQGSKAGASYITKWAPLSTLATRAVHMSAAGLDAAAPRAAGAMGGSGQRGRGALCRKRRWIKGRDCCEYLERIGDYAGREGVGPHRGRTLARGVC